MTLRLVTRRIVLAEGSRDVPQDIHGLVQESKNLHVAIRECPVQELVAGTPTTAADGIQKEARTGREHAADVWALGDASEGFLDDLFVALVLLEAEPVER